MTAQSVQLPQHDVLDAFESAAASARIAAAEFADAADKYGRDVALKQFNSRVSFWANRFTNVRYRRWVYVLGECMDGETHEFTISMASLIKKYRKLFPGQSIGTTTIQKYNRLFDGVIYDVKHNVQGSDDEHPGAYSSHTYTMHFSRVLVGDQVVPHDFTQVSPGAKSAESDTSHSPTKSVNGSINGHDDGSVNGSVNGGGDVLLSHSSSSFIPTSSPTSSHTAEAEETSGREDLGGDEETVDRAKSPAHLLRRNTFKVWTGKSGKVVWYNLDRASKAPADARVVCLDPAEADYLWNGLGTGDRDRDYAACRAFLLAPQGARAEAVYQWQNAASIEAQERAEREEAERQERIRAAGAEVVLLVERYAGLTGKPVADIQRNYSMFGPEVARGELKSQIRKIEAKNAKTEADARAKQARREAKAEAMKLISEWTPTLDGVDLASVRGRISDDPAAYYIDVQTKAIRPARGMTRPGEARVLIQQSTTGPVLANQ